ncbi:N-acetylmuramoyl-L-alanine amidase [Flagellatimonas centrodinii]|uniref:N-acetylmuramoyl-L-alanine amidase n=1 Tax=Flagellatimonas centrodinii TaxID=2806210 RepID=UPI001FEFF140|nr:N-acetylmuramoyl-L-alanine amidase [Flagellatimonas centrodinii]ULQ47386.1 N-acetylmuramoyl-L-alanine amidase [Flagellatimonas centrodinii]
MRPIEQLIIHCAATKPSMDIGAAEIRQWHLGNGWSDIGYNYVIRRNGLIENGRDLDRDGNVDEEVGAHAKGFNARSIGICLVGGLNQAGQPAPEFTEAQFTALNGLLAGLRIRYPNTEILGHRDLPGVAKACPSFDVRHWLNTGLVRP